LRIARSPVPPKTRKSHGATGDRCGKAASRVAVVQVDVVGDLLTLPHANRRSSVL
jgi:hypothetical protein